MVHKDNNDFHGHGRGVNTQQRRGRGGRRGRNNSNSNGGGSRLQCQLCSNMGHTIGTFWHCFDKDFSQVSVTSNGIGGSLPQAFYANPQIVSDRSWYMDSGATHHITPYTEQLENFTLVGMSHLFTCTGEQAKIAGVSTASLSGSNSKLHLNDVLLVANATKQLMSVNKLIMDNNVDVYFTDKSCVVKDKKTRAPIIQGKITRGLYSMGEGPRDAVKNLLWHKKLGHPSDMILRQILHNCNVEISESKFL